MNCPCCGQTVPPETLATPDALVDVAMSPHRKQLLTALVGAHPKGLSAGEIKRVMWGRYPPAFPEAVIRVQMAHIRKAIEPHGWTVPRGRGGQGMLAVYRLVPVVR